MSPNRYPLLALAALLGVSACAGAEEPYEEPAFEAATEPLPAPESDPWTEPSAVDEEPLPADAGILVPDAPPAQPSAADTLPDPGAGEEGAGDGDAR